MKNNQTQKLYVVTRGDITPGYQMAQSGHSIAQYMLDHPEKARQWNNNFLISLSIDNENKLKTLLERLTDLNVSVSSFYEPDINNQLTSIAFESNEISNRLTASLPLALKNLNKQ